MFYWLALTAAFRGGAASLAEMVASTAPAEGDLVLKMDVEAAEFAALAKADRVGGALIERDLQRLQTARVIFPRPEPTS